MRMLAIIAVFRAGIALSHSDPALPMRHMTDPNWKSAESELYGFHTRTSLAEEEVLSLNTVMNRIFEEHHSTLADWPTDIEAFSGTVTAPATITITNAAIETVTKERVTADGTISANPSTRTSVSSNSADMNTTSASHSGSTPSVAIPSPASTGSSNQAPTQSFGVVLLALGAFFL
ncbi:hypothetical protein CJU89_2496 [Yarrowia sp. B02]|nr:hypothetical protein CJU89_2496 [Yarrowia sp. B02]